MASRCIVSNHYLVNHALKEAHRASSAALGSKRCSGVPGISVSGPVAALIAAAVIGLINATLGLLLKILTFPLTILTLGLFWFVINAIMLELAAALVRGFYVRNFVAALIDCGNRARS